MAGWEQLTPNEIMTIVWLVFASVMIFTFGQILRSVINWRISKLVQVKIDASVEKSIPIVNLTQWIKNIREKRKLKREKKQAMVLQGYQPELERYVK